MICGPNLIASCQHIRNFCVYISAMTEVDMYNVGHKVETCGRMRSAWLTDPHGPEWIGSFVHVVGVSLSDPPAVALFFVICPAAFAVVVFKQML